MSTLFGSAELDWNLVFAMLWMPNIIDQTIETSGYHRELVDEKGGILCSDQMIDGER